MRIAPPVLRVRRIEPRTFDRHYREKYRHFAAKAQLFLRSEGPAATLRKYRSKRLERAVEADAAILLCALAIDGARFIGVTRDLGGPATFDTRLLFRVADGRELEDVVVSDRARLLLESYLPVPSCPLPVELPWALLEENPFLSPWTDESVFRWVPPAATTEPPGPVPDAPVPRPAAADGGSVYLLGYGAYAREQVLPAFRGEVGLALDYRAALVRRHGAPPFPLTDSFDHVLDRLSRDAAPRVIIATYHADHAPMANAALEANPRSRIFIEKPPAVTEADLELLLEHRRRGAWIDIGFNRRYAPFTARLIAEVDRLPRPLVLTAIVKELKLPPTHWYFWPNQGTRITGNVCHWIDLAYHLVGCPPEELTLAAAGDTVSLSILFRDGSLATVVASDRGDDLAGVTEEIEVRGGEATVVLRDFRRLEVRAAGRRRVLSRSRRDKGHAAMYADLRNRWRRGGDPRYGIDDLFWVSYLTRSFSEMLVAGATGRTVDERAAAWAAAAGGSDQ